MMRQAPLHLLDRLRRRTQEAPVRAPLLSNAELAEIGALASALPPPRLRSERPQRGEQVSPYRGPGLDFEDLRPYQPGDDTRRIDWHVTARLGKPFVRLYGETRQGVSWVILDRGPSMRFATRARLKAAQAARLAALVLCGADQAQDAMALTLLDGEAHVGQPPRGGRATLHALLQALRAPCPPVPATSPSRWTGVLAELELTLPQGARLWLISDLLGLTPQDEALLERLAARAQLTLCAIEDASERRLPRLGRVHLLTASGLLALDLDAPALRQAYAEARAGRLARLDALATRLRARRLTLGTEMELAELAIQLAGAG